MTSGVRVVVLLYICVLYQQAWTHITQKQAVAGVNMNIHIQCFSAEEDPGSDGYFWRINSSVYGALHVPKEYTVCAASVCDLSTLTIPVVLSEMDRSTFQCVSIDYHTNTVHLGEVTELLVTTLPPNVTFNIPEATATTRTQRGILEFDYTQYSVGPVNTTIGWTYRNLTCQPAVFTVEVLELDNTVSITGSQIPLLTLNSTSTTVRLPNSLNSAGLYLRLWAYNETGSNCAQDSAHKYYHIDSNGMAPAVVSITPSPEGVACVPIPVEGASGQDYSSLEVLWPETPHTPGKLCYCPPFEGDHHLFSHCIYTSSCATHYSVAVRNDSVCFAGLQTSIPVYFTLLQPCQDNRCIIRSLLARFRITITPSILPSPMLSRDGNRVCFGSTVPDLVETYMVNVTDSNGNNTRLSGIYNGSGCLHLTSDLFRHCGSITVSVMAMHTAVIASDASRLIVTNSKQKCLESEETLLLQLYLQGIEAACREWKHVNSSLKSQEIVTELAVYIGQRCNCFFPPSAITSESPEFMCSSDYPQLVTYRASVNVSSLPAQLNRSTLIGVLEEWPLIHRSILIQGERLSVQESCPVLVQSFEDHPQCQVPPTTVMISSTSTPGGILVPLNTVLFTVIPAVAVILLASVIIVIVVLIVHCRYREKVRKKYLCYVLSTDLKRRSAACHSLDGSLRISNGSTYSHAHTYEMIELRNRAPTTKPELEAVERDLTECAVYMDMTTVT